MKSQVNAVWIASASVLAVVGVLSFSLAYQVQSVLRGQNERTIIEAINEMELVKKALPQAAVYSSYQAGYETLKYGGYSTQGCTPEKFNNLPYWKVDDNECFPNNLNQDLARNVKEIMDEYLKALKEEASKIKIEIPEYRSMAIELKGEEITVQTSANEKIKFLIEGLELSDSPNIKTTVKLRIADLINKGIEIFRDKNPVKDQIVFAEQSISNACKKITYEKCFNPFTENVEKTKRQMLDATCPDVLVDFEDSIKKNILGLNSKFDTKDIDVTLETNNDLIQAHVDSEIEKETCTQERLPDYRGKLSDGSACACIEWACPSDKPIAVGSPSVLSEFDKCSARVEAPPSCGGLREISNGLCVKILPKECLEGKEIDGKCYKERVSGCSTPAEPCSYYRVSCDTKSFCFDVATGSSCTSCSEGFFNCDFVQGCESTVSCEPCLVYVGEKQCPGAEVDGECWGEVTSKRCQVGTEIGGKCYATPISNTVCGLKETLYKKTCNYAYSAEANVLVNVEDTIKENKYPVYDESDKKTDFRNLELQFYVLSKNG